MRAFIGLQLDECKKELIEIQNQFKSQGINANYTDSENLHLTLVFLGEIDLEQIEIVKRVLDSIDFSSFELQFTNVRSLRDMVIVEAKETNFLLSLQKEIEIKLRNYNFKIEERKFFPHVTLIRKIKININKKVDLYNTVSKFMLFSSERINNKLTYVSKYTKSANNN